MANTRRTLLRKLALHIGAIEKDPSNFSLKEKDLTEAIAASVPDIEDKTDEEIEAMLEDEAGEPEPEEPKAKTAKPAGKPAGKPGKPAGKAKKEEPEPEPEEPEDEPDPEPEPEEPKKPAGKPGKPAAAAKPGGKPAAASKPEAAKEKPGKDPIVERIDVIGALTEKTKNAVDNIAEKLDVIEAHLVWRYNSDVADKDQIKSLSDVDWTAD
jgi:hypothetical protein